jgi:hypothetical protein
MKITLAVALLVACTAGFWLVQNSRAATETPEYTVAKKDGAFELRDYPGLALASAPMTDGGMNDSFGKLFRYISGANAAQQKIAMTTPVLIDRAGDGGRMSFIVPRSVAARGAPLPNGDEVKLANRAPMRVAALRFQGSRTEENEHAALEKLRAWLATQNLTPRGEPLFAYYDPPWTPVFLRRNEVLIPVANTDPAGR